MNPHPVSRVSARHTRRPAPLALVRDCHSGGAYHWEEYGIAEMLPPAEDGGRILLLGCGDAGEVPYLEDLGFEPVALDIRRDSASDFVADAHRLPVRASSFDVVLSMQVLEHLSAPWQAAREISRVLRPGGCFVGSVAFLKPFHGSYFHMTHEGVRALLGPVGLELEAVDGAQSLSFATYGSVFGISPASVLRLAFRALDRLILGARALFWSVTRREACDEPTARFDPALPMSFRVFDRVRFAPAVVFRARKANRASGPPGRTRVAPHVPEESVTEVEE